MKGKFITLYGINNIGKTTHAKWLVANLRSEGYSAEYIKYPHYDVEPTGPMINNILRSEKQTISEEELQMWYTLNRFQFEPKLREMLEKYNYVVAEDYIGTGLAWGTAKGADLDWLKQLNKHLLKEDIAVLLDGERFLQAKEKIHVHESNDELMKRCREVHLELAEEYNWPIVQANHTKEEVQQSIWEIISHHPKF